MISKIVNIIFKTNKINIKGINISKLKIRYKKVRLLNALIYVIKYWTHS